MDHSNYASFGPGDKVTFGSDFWAASMNWQVIWNAVSFSMMKLIAATYVLEKL